MTIICRYNGGKSYNKHKIMYSYFPHKINNFVDVFTGIGHVFLNYSSHIRYAILNDINKDNYNLLSILQSNLYFQFQNKIRKEYNFNKERFNFYKNTVFSENIDRAVQYILLLNYSVACMNKSYSKSKEKLSNLPKRDFETIHLKLQRTTIFNEDYSVILEKIINKDIKTDFIYLDPPYMKIKNLYKFKEINIENLKNYLEHIDIKWIMSNYPHKELFKLFNGYNFYEYETNNDMANNKKTNKELLISNYPLQHKKLTDFLY